MGLPKSSVSERVGRRGFGTICFCKKKVIARVFLCCQHPQWPCGRRGSRCCHQCVRWGRRSMPVGSGRRGGCIGFQWGRKPLWSPFFFFGSFFFLSCTFLIRARENSIFAAVVSVPASMVDGSQSTAADAAWGFVWPSMARWCGISSASIFRWKVDGSGS